MLFLDDAGVGLLVARAPGLLPLSGSPRLVVLGSEVILGTGIADVLAIEPSGRPASIEVKLRNKAESRRAVVVQVLAHAAALHELTAEQFERDVLAGRLGGRSLFDYVRDEAQDLALELEAVTEGLSVDLVTVAADDVADRRIVVPQRVDPGRRARGELNRAVSRPSPDERTAGPDAFRQQIDAAPEEHRPTLTRFADWAEQVSAQKLAVVGTNRSQAGTVLLPRLLPERAAPAGLWRNPDGRPSLQLWRSVFERRAPANLERIEQLLGRHIGQGTVIPASEQLLEVLFAAYVEAGERASGKLSPSAADPPSRTL